MALADVMPLFDPVVVLLAAPLVAWALMAVYWIMNKREAYAKRLPSAKGILGELKKRDGKVGLLSKPVNFPSRSNIGP
eukprot:1360784-Amorphochlora_amoeboformis.AAC.1